jgi:hypothetical protein
MIYLDTQQATWCADEEQRAGVDVIPCKNTQLISDRRKRSGGVREAN